MGLHAVDSTPGCRRPHHPADTIAGWRNRAGIVTSVATAILKIYWQTGTRKCLLCREGESVELRLYDGNDLVAMWPCDNFLRAAELAAVWLEHPPTWPPPMD